MTGDFSGVPDPVATHLHALWTKYAALPGYSKKEWQALQAAIAALAADTRRRLDLMTVAEVVAQSKFSAAQVRRHLRKGALPFLQSGPAKAVRIQRHDFLTYMGLPPPR